MLGQVEMAANGVAKYPSVQSLSWESVDFCP